MAPNERRIFHGQGVHVAISTNGDGQIRDITTRDSHGVVHYPKGTLGWYLARGTR